MRTFLPEIIINVLHRDYPEILTQINKSLNTHLPVRAFTDLTLVPAIVSEILKYKQVNLTLTDWSLQKGKKHCGLNHQGELKELKFSEVLELVVAVLLKLYHPDKLLGYTSQKKRGSVMHSLVQHTGFNRIRIYQISSNTIVHYKAYHSFKNEVDLIAKEIENKFA